MIIMLTKNQSKEREQLETLTIERVFADAKEKHGMRWTTLRGLKELSMQAMLNFNYTVYSLVYIAPYSDKKLT